MNHVHFVIVCLTQDQNNQTLELMEGKNLFNPIDLVNNQYVLPLALAQYIGYLGPPPLKMIRKSPLFSTYFDEQGKSAFILRLQEKKLVLPKSLCRQLGVRSSDPQNLFRGLRHHNSTRRGKRPVSQVHTQDTNMGSGSEDQLVRAHPR